MKIASQQSFLNNNNLIKLKNEDWIKKQRISGKITAQTLSLLEQLVKEKTTKSLIELDKIAEEFIRKNGCDPTFLGYKGFPNSVCISVDNKTSHALVHGVATHYKLQDGDLISFDLGTTFEGVITDSALTCIYGEAWEETHLKLIQSTKEALYKGITAAKVGNRLGAIGEAIYKSAKGNGFNVFEQYGGHGICINDDGTGRPHADPFISNRDSADRGVRLCSGITLAIEPLLTAGSTETWVGPDRWTVYGKMENCHAEHTVFIHETHTEIMTLREGETL